MGMGNLDASVRVAAGAIYNTLRCYLQAKRTWLGSNLVSITGLVLSLSDNPHASKHHKERDAKR